MEAGQKCPVVCMYYLLTALLIAGDQLLKVFIRNVMELGQSIPVLGDLFKITYIENTGMAFGMMAGKSSLLIGLPVIVLIALALFWRREKDHYKIPFSIAVAMVIAGGASNLFDRIAFGSVTDFLDLKGFAIFNFADICATAGCVLLCFSIWFLEKKE